MNNKGSIWRKWDLQVGTNKYTRYVNSNFAGDKLENLIRLTGLTESQINGDHLLLSNQDYAKLFVEHFAHYNDTEVISLANHNSGDGIDEILEYLKNKRTANHNPPYSEKYIYPGVEIGGNDKCHILIVFNPETTSNQKFEFAPNGKTKLRELTWKEYVEKFLDDIKIPNPRFNNNQPVNSSSFGVKDIISKCEEWDFVPIFPHITNSEGLWKELQESNKKEIYNHHNFGIVDIPLTSTNQDLKRICDGKHTAWGEKAIGVINTSDAESLLKIGEKFSYIKCDPTIKGLKHLFIEPLDRIRTGQEPEIFQKVKNNRTKYLKSIAINSIAGYDNKYGKWFDNIEIPLNHELVAIIGNKGSGKSALADIISLCGNYKGNHEDFSFLNSKKFNMNNGRIARNFEATITWESDTVNLKTLNNSSDAGDIELVKYLPQGYFERLTNEISSAEEFKKEIENVVYTHLDNDEKIGVNTFEELINKKKELINHEISILKERLSIINQSIFEKEKKLNTTYKASIEAHIKKKKEELIALIEPIEIKNPNEDPEIAQKNRNTTDQITAISDSIETLEEEIVLTSNQKRDLLIEINELKDLKQKIQSKENELNYFKISHQEKFQKVNININEIIKYKFDYTSINSVLIVKEEELKNHKVNLGEEPSTDPNHKSLTLQLSEKQLVLQSIQQNLGEVEKKYQDYLVDKKQWEENKKQIIGDENLPNTLKFFEKELKYINENLINELNDERENRFGIVESIFNNMETVLDIYKAIKTKIDSIISENTELLDLYKINIEASFNLKHNFQDKFLNFISLNKVGTYYGKDNAELQIKKIINDVNFDNYKHIINLLSSLIESFFKDNRNQNLTFIENQVEEVVEFYNYLFSLEFLDYNYELRQGDKNLEQLSPGEKGALLLIFYLLLDNNDIPLIIDQPEDNLDNHSVANVLVPFIKKAKTKRQIILVTHNPNLAVVADAEQVIYVELDKENNNIFSFKSGSIENPGINECIVKVLEGAMPAFNKRKMKYYN